MITVKSNLSANQVALWERDPAHPGGEVFIAGPGEHEVGETAAVKARLKDGWLVKVGEIEPKAPAPPDVDDAPFEAALLRGKVGDEIADLLIGAGYTSVDLVRAAVDDDLLAIDGIGAKRLAAIREALD